MRYNAVIFDLDGTLADTLPVCVTAFQRAFARFSERHFSQRELISMFGPTEEGTCKEVVPEHWEAALEAYLEEYERAHYICNVPFEGMRDVLDLLRGRSVPVAMVTGKGPVSAEISLRHLDLAEYFEIIETGSSKGKVKPECIARVVSGWSMEPGNVAYVGDTAYDMEAAIEAGLVPLGAGWAESATVNEGKAMARIFRTVEAFRSHLEAKTPIK